METQGAKAERFLALHAWPSPLLLPNPWDLGSARLFAWLGFEALATTSSGLAATRGRLDGSMDRADALSHAATIASGTDLPVSADLENDFGSGPDQVAETVRLALDSGLVGCSIEDFTGSPDDPIYDTELASERMAAAAEVARSGRVHLVLTGRSEDYLHGRADLSSTIARLQAYQDAGADVLYAPGLTDLEEIRRVVADVDRPVNALVRPGGPTVNRLAEVGVSRISVGGALCFAALGAVVEAARELRDEGAVGCWERTMAGQNAARAAFADRDAT